MKAKTVFLARVPDGKGKFPFVEVTIKNNRPVPIADATAFYARYSGKREDGSQGRIVQPLGKELDAAFVCFMNLKQDQENVRAGLEPRTPKILAGDAKQTLMEDVIENYLKERVEAVGNQASTVDAYGRAIRDFAAVCAERGVTTLEQIRREDLLAYLVWLRKNLIRQSIGNRESTLAARMRRLGTFLRKYGIKIRKDQSAALDDKGLLDYNEVPREPKKKAVKYGRKTVQALLAAAEKTKDEDTLDLIQFLLFTGFRDEEVAYCEWDDINFREGSVNVHAKLKSAQRDWEWRPKDKEERPHDIPLPADFIERMEARRKRYAQARCNLIFPSGACRPDTNLLRRVRRVAKAAGIEQRVTLHAFRRTFGSNVAAKHGIEIARQFLGHSDIATTQRYLAADGDETEAFKANVNDLWAEFQNA